MNLERGQMHCEAFVIWGWLHKLPMVCHTDASTNNRWPRSHAMCLLMQRWPSLHATWPLSPPQGNSRCFAVCHGKLAPLSEPLHAAVRHGQIRGLSYSCIMIALYYLLSRSLALSCLSCPAISSSLSMPPLCSGQVGLPRLQPLGLLLPCRQGRSQVCDDSL